MCVYSYYIFYMITCYVGVFDVHFYMIIVIHIVQVFGTIPGMFHTKI